MSKNLSRTASAEKDLKAGASLADDVEKRVLEQLGAFNAEIAVKNFTDDQVQEFRDAFNEIDTDGGGSLSADELGQLLRNLGQEPTETELYNIIYEADTDGNGEIDFDEFLGMMAKGAYDAEKERLEMEFSRESFDRESMTPLIKCAVDGNTEGMKNMINNGECEIDATNILGRTALMYACENCNAAAVQILLDNKAEKEIRSNIGMTSLMWAAYSSSVACMELLIKAGADINAKDNIGMTPMMWSVVKGDSCECVELLLRHGADKKLKSNNGKTAFDWSEQKEHIKAMELLR